MDRMIVSLLFFVIASGAFGQTPTGHFTYEDRSGTTGHTLVIEGKSFGPYKDVTSVTNSTSATAGLFLVTKRDKMFAVAQGKEWGPLAAGQDVDQSWVSDDGKVWAVTTVKQSNDDSDTNQTSLWVNGKVFGPFEEVSTFEYSETGGHWIATVKQAEDEYNVLLDGKAQGPFASVVHSWLFPDGKSWGWATTDADGATTVVTQDKTYSNVQSVSFDQMYPRDPHWAYGLKLGDEEELIVVDGKAYNGYLNFSGLYSTTTWRHWGFTAEKLADAGDYPVVVIDGKEYVGEGLSTASLGDREWFTWSVTDGTKVTVQVLALP